MSEMHTGSSADSGMSGLKTFLLAGLLGVMAAGNVYFYWKADRLGNDVSQWRASVQSEISELREHHSASTADQNKRLDALQEVVSASNRQAIAVARRSQVQAQKHAEGIAARLAGEHKQQQELLTGELTQVKEAATTANTRIEGVTTDVSHLKTEVATTRTDVDKMAFDMKRVAGDMGVMSGLIATNSNELAALKELGERHYVEFELARSKRPQKISDVSLMVRKADPKRNKYSIDVYADDRKVEKKDKTINEPVQFYVSRNRQPYEIVVNQVKQDRLIGYLATPKVKNP